MQLKRLPPNSVSQVPHARKDLERSQYQHFANQHCAATFQQYLDDFRKSNLAQDPESKQATFIECMPAAQPFCVSCFESELARLKVAFVYQGPQDL